MNAASLLARGLNRALQHTPGAKALLSQHAGKTLRVDSGISQLDFGISAAGELIEPAPDATPDVTLRATSAMLLQLPFAGRGALRQAEFSGDPALLQTLERIIAEAHLDLGAELSPLIGDIAAHRVAQAAQQVTHTVRAAAQALQTSGSEYVVEEIALLARKSDVARWSREADMLVDDIARFEARLARLEAMRASQNPAPTQS